MLITDSLAKMKKKLKTDKYFWSGFTTLLLSV